MKRIIALLIALLLVCAFPLGCDFFGEKALLGKDLSQSPTENVPSVTADFAKDETEMFSDRGKNADYRESGSVLISLNGTGATASSDSVKIAGGFITLTEEATYIVTGQLSDGTLVVNAPDTAKIQIVLDGADITSKSFAALYVLQADKVFVTLSEGTENILVGGDSFTATDDNNVDGAVFSKSDLSFNGTGALTVSSPAGHGIVCKDDLVFTGGSYAIKAASHGLDANDSVRITGQTDFDITSGKDGVHCENSEDASLGYLYVSDGTWKIASQGDGLSASASVQIEGGFFELLVGGGSKNGTKATSDRYGSFPGGGRPGMMRPGASSSSASDESAVSMKGIKAGSGLLIRGGDIRIDSADDAIHSNASLTVSGGHCELASGDDAIHAEDTLSVTGGEINVSESYEGLEAFHIVIAGGQISLTASDDGLNAAGGADASGTAGGRDGMFGGGRPGGAGGGVPSGNGSITVSGGTLRIKASGDGIDANGTLSITGGDTVVTGPTQGDTATLDFDKSATITGGSFIGTGASGMAQSFSSGTQGVIALSVGNQAAGTPIRVTDQSGKLLISHEPSLSFAVVILSTPELRSGESYVVSVGAQTGTFQAN